MLNKITKLTTIFFCFAHCISYPDSHRYQCVYSSTPEIFKDYFYSPDPGGKILYGGIDRHGRYLIEKRPPHGPSLFYAFYEDEHGRLWQILIDRAEKKETPLVRVKDPNTVDTYDTLHPDQVKEMYHVPKENILYPPRNIPKLNDNDFEMLDVQFGFNQPHLTNSKTDKNTTHFSDTDNYNSPDSYDIHNDEHEAQKEITTPPTDSNWSSYFVWSGVAGMLAIGYYYALTNVALCNRFLAREDTWSTWRSDESYETLLMIEPKYLADSLIKDINTTYYKEPNPIQLFLRDIAEEYDTICKWMQFRNTLRRFWLPLGRDFNTMENRLKLLTHMRKVAHYWRSQQLSIETS